MAILDVKQYYATMVRQYLEMKADLADFEEALKAGYITEEQMSKVKEDVEQLEINKDRLSYILYLLELPKRKSKKVKYKKANQSLESYFAELNADEQSVMDENISLITDIRKELERLKVGK